MKKLSLALCLSVCAAAPALARDDTLHLPFQAVLDTPEAKEKLDGSVKFYLAGAPTPKVTEKLGSDISNRKTNSVGKTVEQACNRAALSALMAFQDKARAQGANAVVDIVSIYKQNEFRSATEFECHDGAMMSGVALRGTYAKVKN